MMNISLLKAEPSDAERLLEIQKICFLPHLERYQDYETSPAMASLERIKWQIENEDFFKILLKDIWVGSISIRKMDEMEYYYLHIINILPKYQGMGIGQAVIRFSEEKFPNAKKWCLETLEDMPYNRHVYEKAGYIFTGKTEKINDKLTLVYYQKEII
ncbi:acetyltransferase (GNAT) family protein [Ruminiclostridium hungatei]|uniref:Acetyltransferase (GNAT) family protein n=1 Tax=Ruminiclostridium hungatei TaxID=48256 RepID=A0A1V4SFE4_RUMHU|nr:GNAT family N-acetyltransferase [Ruminiclostridium hungatei]OPX42185.1 acetyltransferase (GNAT) family protein [Ruminiclostridium hungatei]